MCLSVNDEVVHGIPGDRVVEDGDVVSIDCGAIVGGYHADSAITVCVGSVPPEVVALVSATAEALTRGLAAVREPFFGYVEGAACHHKGHRATCPQHATCSTARCRPGSSSATPNWPP